MRINSTFFVSGGLWKGPGQNIQMDILPGTSRFFWCPPFYLSDGSGRDLSALSVASRSPAVFLANLELKFADAMFAAAILENVRAWREVLHLLYIASPNGWRSWTWRSVVTHDHVLHEHHVHRTCKQELFWIYAIAVFYSNLSVVSGFVTRLTVHLCIWRCFNEILYELCKFVQLILRWLIFVQYDTTYS